MTDVLILFLSVFSGCQNGNSSLRTIRNGKQWRESKWRYIYSIS